MRNLIGKRWIWKAVTQSFNDAIANRRSFTTDTRFFRGLMKSHSSNNLLSRSPWFFSQQRGAKVFGTDVRAGNIVQRKGCVYQVLKAQHAQNGRGGSSIQVELCDVDSGNKVTERFRTDESIESMPFGLIPMFGI